jgi:hypothetical protein
VISTLCLFLLLGGGAYAATGGNFILGNPNTASSKTSLSAPISDKALQLTTTNTGAGATALGLDVASGHAPFMVNSDTRVGCKPIALTTPLISSGSTRRARTSMPGRSTTEAGPLPCDPRQRVKLSRTRMPTLAPRLAWGWATIRGPEGSRSCTRSYSRAVTVRPAASKPRQPVDERVELR